jgi:G3E family GTPase
VPKAIEIVAEIPLTAYGKPDKKALRVKYWGAGPPDQLTIPVMVITGFLGSGKTTLISRLLQIQNLTDTGVIVDAFGETDLDHIQTFTWHREQPMGFTDVMLFFQELVNYDPDTLLRVKGLLAVAR